MGKVVQFVGRLTGFVGAYATGGMDNALASLKYGLAIISGNPFIMAAAVASDFVSTFLTKSGSHTPTSAPVVFRQAVSDSFIVYGKRRVGGLLVFFHGRKSGSDHYRYFVTACAGHRCQGVTKWFLGDEEVTVDGSGKVTSGAYANAAWLWFQRGLDSETANATFVSDCGGNWTSAHKGNGIAAIYVKFKMTDAVVEAGMPNITAEIEGKDDILDPRDASTGYANNGALVFYDWLKLPREEGGFGAYADEIPDDDWISAQANVCDEVVDGEARYALDAVITTGASPGEVRSTMAGNMAGMVAYVGGKHLMRVGYWVPSTTTLNEAELAGPIQVSPFLTGDEAANEIQGTYINPAEGYQSSPLATQTTDPAPSDIRQLSLDLAFVTSKSRGERILRIILGRAQCEKRVTWPMTVAGLAVKAMDTVQLDTDRYGLSNYAWAIDGWGFSSDYGVSLSLREENEDIYTDGTPVEPDDVPEISIGETIETVGDASTLIRSSAPRGVDLSAADAGTGFATITVSDHIRDYPDRDVAITGADITGAPLSTAAVYVYYDDQDRDDPTPSYQFTTDISDATNSTDNPFRHYVGFTPTPGPGDPPTSGEGPPYPGGSFCVADDSLILMADGALAGPGAWVPARDVKVGDWVWTRHEKTLAWAAYQVEGSDYSVEAVLHSPDHPDATADHRFWDGGWKPMRAFGEPLGEGRVWKARVESARTYIAAHPNRPSHGVLSHNIKPMPE